MQGLLSLLTQTLSDDGEQVKAATAQLQQQYYKNPAALANLAAHSQEQAIRQLAAKELKKRIEYNNGKLLKLLPKNECDQVKANFPKLVSK
ncbi:hypothetical protein EV421DRAFT_1909248 [Armillaria borealis]|uniref:Importin N-terminal domain-containing protein n=1 Tax=Armillaria borealis TaxID=47425 RepID=A0AA39J5A7_9AGAR|nr:hypothetical protein EV421DRAFT_1909248 [Armillaria borealis]